MPHYGPRPASDPSARSRHGRFVQSRSSALRYPRGMGANDNKQRMQQVVDALAQGDARPLIACMADDVVWTIIGSTPWSRAYEGKPAVLGMLAMLQARL